MKKISNIFYNKINKKFEDGTFIMGDKCKLNRYYYGDRITINDFSLEERTPEVCVSLMDYSKCNFNDVPEFARTREFFIHAFTDEKVYDYIKRNIDKFDRKFFKDLIVTNEYSTCFDRNCFEIMPLQYIDDEMCSLAILKSTGWAHDRWFYSVCNRKIDAISEDVWKLGARLYARMSGGKSKFVDVTPLKYKDIEYYKEMCCCNYNCGIELEDNKGKIMDYIPQEIITLDFVLGLLAQNIKNIVRFNEKALEMNLTHTDHGNVISEKIWQFVVRSNGDMIKYIELNDERADYFMSLYDKDSMEYIYSFKGNYKRYKKQKEDAEGYARTAKRAKDNMLGIADRVVMGAILYANEGEKPEKAITDEIERNKGVNPSLLPINYSGRIPDELKKIYDSEEYLVEMYKRLGIEVIEEYDYLFYKVVLPNGWKIETNDNYHYNVKDVNGNVVIEYIYNSKFYDMEASVRIIQHYEDEKYVRTKKITD